MKKLYQINPFNTLWFKDCYHMAMLPVIVNNLGNAECILYNQFFTYDFSENGITVVSNDFTNLYDILTSKNIECMPFVKVYDLICFVKTAIQTNHCIIIGLDNYYEEIRRDLYMIKHQAHSVLIHGIDTEKEIVNILEQPFFYSYDYKSCCLSFKSLEDGYNNFVERRDGNFKDFFYKQLTSISCIQGLLPSACIISVKEQKKKSKNDLQARERFIESIQSNISEIYEKIECINRFIEDFEKFYLLCNDENNQFIVNNLSEVINNKLIEHYLYSTLFELESDILRLQKSIIIDWGGIRSILSKYMFSKKRIDTHIISSCEKLKRIICSEKIITEAIYQKIQKRGHHNV